MIREWVGLFLVLVLVTLYFFFYPQRVNLNETRRIAGRLANAPHHGVHGGDFNYHFVRLTLVGYSDDFEVQRCSYDRLNYAALNRLTSGDSLVLFVFEDRVEGEFDVYGIETGDEVILSLSDVNDCNFKGWKKTFYLAVLIGAFLFVRFLLVPLWRRFTGKRSDTPMKGRGMD